MNIKIEILFLYVIFFMSIICHGGASGFLKQHFAEIERKYSNNPVLSKISNMYEKGIKDALKKGQELLDENYSADEIVVAVISCLENNELFNAGKGCCLTVNGKIELDAIIVDSYKNYGALTLGENIKNPIQIAKRLKDEFGMKMLGGDGINDYVKKYDSDCLMPKKYFLSENKNIINHEVRVVLKDIKYSTVGCVVRDKNGNIAAGTSTGGILNKMWGRIGDTPVLGSGTYVEKGYGGISCTGRGEVFMRECVAYDILAKMKYEGKKMDLCIRETFNKLPEKSGGCIGIDNEGKCYAYFNSVSMFYGYIKNGEIIYNFEDHLMV